MLNSYIAAGDGLNAGEYKNPEFRTATVASVACAALGAAQSKIMTSPFPPTFSHNSKKAYLKITYRYWAFPAFGV